MSNELKIELKRKGGIPLYLQIKNELASFIRTHAGEQKITLPPQRELAEQLSVSRNTVSMAYTELEREGLVVSTIGRGTVALAPMQKNETRNRNRQLKKALEHLTEEALSLNFEFDEFYNVVRNYLREKRAGLKRTSIVFIECNREQLLYFSEHLSLGTNVKIIPMLLADLRTETKKNLKVINNADLIITSFYHLDEVEELIDETGRNLVGINLQAEMSTIVGIARLSSSATIGIVVGSKQFLDEVMVVVDNIGLHDHEIKTCITRDRDEIEAFANTCDAIIISPSRMHIAHDLLGDKPTVTFQFVPDDTSIKTIKVALLEHRQKRKGDAKHARSNHRVDVPGKSSKTV